MSISATGSSNFISHDTIDAWMEMKVSDAYADMRDGMDTSGHRADAEKALNEIKAKLVAAKNNGGETDGDLNEQIQNALKEFGDVPGVEAALSPIAATSSDEHVSSVQGGDSSTTKEMPKLKLDGAKIDGWSNAIGDAVDALGKQDQLGMINLNQLNSHINQAEQTASALLDSRNKTAEAIINRIG